MAMLPVMLIVASVVFFIVQLMPGSVVDYMFGGDLGEEGGVPTIGAERMRERLGLDLPMHVQYWNWLKRIVRLDLGKSMMTSDPVIARIIEKFPHTFLLMATALVVGIMVAVPVGVFSAVKQYSLWDHIVTGTSFTAISIPSFFIALGGIYIFSVVLGWVPVGGQAPVGVRTPDFVTRMHHLLLPMSVVALGQAARFARYVRSGMLDVISEQYIQTARSKGLSERIVILKHALPNALLPMITMVGLSLPMIFGGSVVIERVFSWPGIGLMTITALRQRDLTLIVGLNLFFSAFVILSNLITDLTYAIIDPRIRYD